MTKCVCGEEATEDLPEGVDEVMEVPKERFAKAIFYDKLCKKCYDRVKKLSDRFKPSFGGEVYTVKYHREEDLFCIYTFSVYGDKASLCEGEKHTTTFSRNMWTGEYVVLKDDEVVGVI